METDNKQDLENAGLPTPKQFRTKFQEIFESETNFGSSRAARLELLESAADIIREYLNHGCPIVYLYGKLKEAGYTGSRKELSEWLVSQGLWTKRETSGKKKENGESLNSESCVNSAPDEKNLEDKKSESVESHSPVEAQTDSAGNPPISHEPDSSNPITTSPHQHPENQTSPRKVMPDVKIQSVAIKNSSQNTNNRGS